MADEESQPLLKGQASSSTSHLVSTSSSHRVSTISSTRSGEYHRSFQLSSESTPLLHRRDDITITYGTDGANETNESEDRHSRPPSIASREAGPPDDVPTKKSRVRWPTVISLVGLTTGVLAILVFAFATPAVVKEYAQGAAVFEPTTLSINSTTPERVRARIQGNFVMDSSRVKSNSVRNYGRFMTWIAREVETGPSDVDVYLPEYGNVLIGTAAVPNIKVNIRNGHENKVDFLTDLTAGDVKGIHAIAMDWIEGRLARLRVKGKATLHLKSGLILLGTQVLSDTVTFEEEDFPALPDVNIVQLNVHDGDNGTLKVDGALNAKLHSPVALTVPALGFEILVPNCRPGEPHILTATAHTQEINVKPNEVTSVNVEAIVTTLPEELTTACPDSEGSPLDSLVSSYIKGLETTIYVRGADAPPSSEAPDWMVDLLKSVTIPLPFTNSALDNLVKNFSMSDTHFSLPDPFAEPDSPEANPTVSALVKVIIALPEEMNLSVDVPQVRALTDVFYLDRQLGTLNIDEWRDSNSTKIIDVDGESALLVEFAIEDAPLEVTDGDLLTELVQAMLFGSGDVNLHVAANVDAIVSTGLGQFAIRGIPADGNVPVQIPSGNSIEKLSPRIVSLEVVDTTHSSLQISTRVNFTNPTDYSATVPYADALVIFNDTAVAHVVVRNFSVVPGNNTNATVEFSWNPLKNGGKDGVDAGRKLISSFISGSNTTITLQTHEGSIPALPKIGKALSAIPVDFKLPTVSTPGSPGDDDGDDGGKSRPRFIQDATFHLWASTADFLLFSPLTSNDIIINSIHAVAFYEEDEPVGRINYEEPFTVPPGLARSPRLPVDMVLGGGAYDALRRALGDSMAMDIMAKVGVKIGNYEESVVYRGKGIEANVRL